MKIFDTDKGFLPPTAALLLHRFYSDETSPLSFNVGWNRKKQVGTYVGKIETKSDANLKVLMIQHNTYVCMWV